MFAHYYVKTSKQGNDISFKLFFEVLKILVYNL